LIRNFCGLEILANPNGARSTLQLVDSITVCCSFDDNANVTVMEIRAKARRLKAKYNGLGLIVIDYLQLMSGNTK